MGNKLDVNNPLVTKEDLKDHVGVGGVIIDDETGMILLLYHKKYNFWTIPLGKVDADKNIKNGLIRELKEELDINVTDCSLMGSFVKTYDRGHGIHTTIKQYLFIVNKFNGTIYNKEFKKHPIIKWETHTNLFKIPDNKLSDMTKFYIQKMKSKLKENIEE